MLPILTVASITACVKAAVVMPRLSTAQGSQERLLGGESLRWYQDVELLSWS